MLSPPSPSIGNLYVKANEVSYLLLNEVIFEFDYEWINLFLSIYNKLKAERNHVAIQNPYEISIEAVQV